MFSPVRRLYGLMGFFCFSGYTWLYLHLDKRWSDHVGSVCIMKKTVGIPCPSCGSTRSMLSLLQGDFETAIAYNPFGYIIMGGLMVVPCWLIYDLIGKKRTLYSVYQLFEATVQRRIIAWMLVLIVVLNWGWNIYKGV